MKTPYRKIGKVTFPFYFLLVLYLTNYLLNVSFVLFEHFPEKGDLAFVYLALGLLIGVLFAAVARREPGYIYIEEQQNDFEMLRNNHPSKVCFDCMVRLPPPRCSSPSGRGTARSASGASASTTTTAPGSPTASARRTTSGSTPSSSPWRPS